MPQYIQGRATLERRGVSRRSLPVDACSLAREIRLPIRVTDHTPSSETRRPRDACGHVPDRSKAKNTLLTRQNLTDANFGWHVVEAKSTCRLLQNGT